MKTLNSQFETSPIFLIWNFEKLLLITLTASLFSTKKSYEVSQTLLFIFESF
jgi:hypothetical protein